VLPPQSVKYVSIDCEHPDDEEETKKFSNRIFKYFETKWDASALIRTKNWCTGNDTK
jgi:hypothetical protein